MLFLARRRMQCSFFFYHVLVWTSLLVSVYSDLPPYTGPYNVGTIDLEIPVTPQVTISNITFKATGQPAFKVCLLIDV